MDGVFISCGSFRRKSREHNKNKCRAIIANRRCVWREQINFNKFLSYNPAHSQRPLFLIPKLARILETRLISWKATTDAPNLTTTHRTLLTSQTSCQYTHAIRFLYASHFLVVLNGLMSYFFVNTSMYCRVFMENWKI